jgi:hypothetical protein
MDKALMPKKINKNIYYVPKRSHKEREALIDELQIAMLNKKLNKKKFLLF